jgi:hypothetical protein
MGCTSCIVPLTEEPMMTFDLNTALLFKVRLRKHGAAAPGILPAFADCELKAGYKIFSVTDLVTFIASWSAIFSNTIADMGISLTGAGGSVNANTTIPSNDPRIDRRENHGVRLLGIALTPGGVFQLVGSDIFWNNFYIQTSPYAREILGLPQAYLSISYTGATQQITNNDDAILLTGNGTVIRTMALLDQIPVGSPPLAMNANYSIFRKTEERMLFSMEVALSIPMNLTIVNGIETRTHTIFTAPLETNIRSVISGSNGSISDKTTLEINAWQGRVHLLKKTDGNVQWYPLTSSYAIQNSRCEIFVTRRRYHSASETWSTKRLPLKVHKDSVWNASLKFVSVY